ncbi:retrovirus-related pol polyprotein from transposon TNT 1-94 [Tanacetum coccineum]
MSKKVKVIKLSDSNDALSGRGIEKVIEGSSKASIPPFGSAKRPRPEVCARVAEMFRTRTVPPNVINWYGYVDLAEYHVDSLYWDTWLPEEGPFDEFPAETDKEDEDSDMSLQFQRPKGSDVNYVPKNIAKSPTFILNVVIGVANKTTWAMIEQKMGKRDAGNKGKWKEKNWRGSRVFASGEQASNDGMVASQVAKPRRSGERASPPYPSLLQQGLKNISSISKFDVEKFDGSNDFGLWRVKMRCLLIQHGWEAALDPFPRTMIDTDKTAALKTDVYKKAHSTLLLCLDNKVLREVNKEDSAAGVWLKLDSMYMTKSLANKLYLKKKLFTFYMHSGKKLSERIDEFNKLIGDLANIDVDIDDEDLALMLLTSLPSSYDNFVETLLYGRESLTLEDVLSSLNSWELKKRTYAKDDSDGLYKDCPKRNKKKSTDFVKKNAGQGSGMHSEGYDNDDLLMAVSEDRFLEWIMDSGGSYHMTLRRDFLFDFKEFNGGTVLLSDNRACAIKGTGKVRVQMKDGSSFMLENVRYIPELKRNLISVGTLDQEAYTMKLHNGRVKVIKGEASVGIQENESLAQVWHKRLGHISEVGLHELERRDVLGNKGLGKLEFCENCVLGKSTTRFVSSGFSSSVAVY